MTIPTKPKSPFIIRKLEDVEPAESITLLGYGAAKSGKTDFGGTAGSRAVIINIGDGIVTLKSPSFKSRHPDANPTVVDLTEAFSLDQITSENNPYNIVCDAIDQVYDTVDFDTLIVDEATALRRYAMQKGMAIAAELKGSKAFVNSKKFGVELPEIGDYGVEMDLTEKFIAGEIERAKKNKKNFILFAHERITYGKPPKIGDPPPVLKISPAFTGRAFPDEIVQYFDLVWHFEKVGGGDSVMHRIRTKGDEGLVADSRWGGIFNVTEDNLTWPEVVRKIQEQIPAVAKRLGRK